MGNLSDGAFEGIHGVEVQYFSMKCPVSFYRNKILLPLGNQLFCGAIIH